MTLFLDLDGTLINSKPRLFNLFRFLVPQSDLSFEEYWDLKKEGKGHEIILREYYKYTDKEIEQFQNRWYSLIEAPEWIQYDQPFDLITEKLQELKKKFSLVLVTARQSDTTVHSQLALFGWTKLFSHTLVTKQKHEKEELIKNLIQTSPSDWFIGDTGKDVQAGKALGTNTIGVLSGFRSREQLEKYQPDFILNSLLEFHP